MTWAALLLEPDAADAEDTTAETALSGSARALLLLLALADAEDTTKALLFVLDDEEDAAGPAATAIPGGPDLLAARFPVPLALAADAGALARIRHCCRYSLATFALGRK